MHKGRLHYVKCHAGSVFSEAMTNVCCLQCHICTFLCFIFFNLSYLNILFLMPSTFLAIDKFKKQWVIFIYKSQFSFNTALYFTVIPQYICSHGIPPVYHTLSLSPTELFHSQYILTTLQTIFTWVLMGALQITYYILHIHSYLTLVYICF